MTLEEAIRLLDPKTTGEAISEIEYYNGFSGKTAAVQAISDACEIAVEAMGKQIPKKLCNIKTAPNDNYISYGDCPCCNANVFEYEHYCSECGQKIDWSDKNDRA